MRELTLCVGSCEGGNVLGLVGEEVIGRGVGSGVGLDVVGSGVG